LEGVETAGKYENRGIEFQIEGGQKNNNMDNVLLTIGLLDGFGGC